MENEMKSEAIGEEDLANELLPIMRDFFAGKFTCDGNVLQCVFRNGEQFRIIVNKIK